MALASQHVHFGEPVRFRTHGAHRLRGLALADTNRHESVPVAFHRGSRVRVRRVAREDVEPRRSHASDKELRRFASTLRGKNIDELPLEDLHAVAVHNQPAGARATSPRRPTGAPHHQNRLRPRPAAQCHEPHVAPASRPLTRAANQIGRDRVA